MARSRRPPDAGMDAPLALPPGAVRGIRRARRLRRPDQTSLGTLFYAVRLPRSLGLDAHARGGEPRHHPGGAGARRPDARRAPVYGLLGILDGAAPAAGGRGGVGVAGAVR